MKRAAAPEITFALPRPAFTRPTMLTLPEYARLVAAGEFAGGLTTEKRDGFHIVCQQGSDCLIYRTKNDNSLIGAGPSPVRRTLHAIEEYLRADGDRFDPGAVFTDEDGNGEKLHIEFCVRLKGEKRDDLQALMHGKWVANPSMYDVHVAVFDVEFERDEDVSKYSSRYYALKCAFPQHVVRSLQTPDEIIRALSECEGIVAYTRSDYPKKIKAPHPIPMKIVGMRRSVISAPGYDQFLLAVASGPTTYTAMHELDYSDVLCEPDEDTKGKAFVRPNSLMYDEKTKTLTSWSKSVVAPVLCAVNTAALQSPRVDAISYGGTHAKLANKITIDIPGSRRFKIDKDYVFIVPVSIVVSPNAVWRIKGGAIHMQAVSVLAVGDKYGVPRDRRLLARKADIFDVNAVIDEDMCSDPVGMHEYMHNGRSADPFKDLRIAFAARAEK